MFNNKRIKELRQRIRELELTCNDLDVSLDYKNDIIKDLQRKITEHEYREKLWENDRKELKGLVKEIEEQLNKISQN